MLTLFLDLVSFFVLKVLELTLTLVGVCPPTIRLVVIGKLILLGAGPSRVSALSHISPLPADSAAMTEYDVITLMSVWFVTPLCVECMTWLINPGHLRT